ncbi:MAG: cysteine desulfurase [Rhodothermales bacterium]
MSTTKTRSKNADSATAAVRFDAAGIRTRFPILQRDVYGTPLVYLDNAATSQKPQSVIDRITRYYAEENSNVHRGVHYLSQRATDAYEGARTKAAAFINAPSDRQIVYTRGTTEAINLVASSFGPMRVEAGDVVLITTMEHHSNIVPWQMLCEKQGAELRVVPIFDTGEIVYEEFERLLPQRVKLLALSHVSNTLGTINPIRRMIRAAHDLGIPVVVDGAQAVPHMPVDVQELDCDFYCFSSHKMFGPTGIGILYGKSEHLDAMPPYQGGGDMIETVSFERTTYSDPPHRFEAGTPNIAGAVGLGAAIDFMEGLDQSAVRHHENALLEYATERMSEIDGIRFIGTADHKASVLSFLIGDVHPYDAGTILDRMGIAVRTGHHCTEPLMRRFGIPGTVRASMALYNTREDVDRLVEGAKKVRDMFG